MLFHEFVFILGRIAHTTVAITDSEDPSITEKLSILLVEKLQFRSVDPVAHLEKMYNRETAS